VVCRCVYHAGERGRPEHREHQHPPPLLRALARRVVRVLLAVSPHLPLWARRVPRPMTTTTQRNQQAPTPTAASDCSQGGLGGANGRRGSTKAANETTTQHPPPPLRATARRGDCRCWRPFQWHHGGDDNGTTMGGQRRQREGTTPTTTPRPGGRQHQRQGPRLKRRAGGDGDNMQPL
jgi:hypothetical protein